MSEMIKDEDKGNNVLDKACCYILVVFAIIIAIAVGTCLYTYIQEQISEEVDASYNYSHKIHINTNVRKTSLENWHQALVDSIYTSTHWNNRYFHPSVTINIDSVHVTYPVELDSLVLCLSEIDRLYKEYYNDALNDLRQESNNNINKWSAWLGFWISILALLMGLLPIAIQFKLSNRSEKRLEREFKRLEEQFHKKEEELELRLSRKSKIVDYNLRKQELGRLKSKVVNVINAIDLSKNNKLLTDSQERELLLRALLVDLRKQLCEFVKENKKVNVCKKEDKYNDLLIVLIEIHGVVTKLIPHFQSKMSSRRIYHLQSDLQELILEIAKDYSTLDFNKIERIQEKFYQLVDEFK